MTEFSDQDLREAFDAEYDETLRTEVVASFRGRQRWMIIMVWVVSIPIFAASVWAVVRFLQTDASDLKSLIAYAALFLWTSAGVGLLKTWYYNRLDRNAVLRAVKREELRLAQRDENPSMS